MRYAILGPVEAWHDDGNSLDVPRPRLRSLLVVLLVHGNKTLSTDRIIQLLWGSGAPPDGHHAIHSYMSALRRLTMPSRVLASLRPGYRIEIKPGELDLDDFRMLLEGGKQNFTAGDFERARYMLMRACEVWRDVSLPDFPVSPPMLGIARRLIEELHMAEDLLVDAHLSTGRSGEVIPALMARTTERPGHERAWAQLMVALYQSDRRVQALDTYMLARRVLLEEFGTEPGETMRILHQGILHDDSSLKKMSPAARFSQQRLTAQLRSASSGSILDALIAG